MKKKSRLKFYVMPALYGLLSAIIVITVIVLTKVDEPVEGIDNNTYVNSNVISRTTPTITEEKSKSVTIAKPFSNEKVTLYKKYYDKKMNESEMKNAILFYNNTYVQNTGVIYKSEEQFDVLSILDGVVIDIKDDDTLGKVVEIKHENNMISTYEGLSEVSVKKDQNIVQGDIIGKSGTLNIDNKIDNSLLIEIIYNGKLVNPESYFDKKINEL